MKTTLLACVLLAAAAPAAAAPVAEDKVDAPSKLPADFDMSMVMGMLDKLFPAQPDPDPRRLALARATAAGVLPNGTYAGMFEELMGGMVDHVLALSAADFVPKDAKGKPTSKMTLRQEIAKSDPHFDERLRIMRRVVGEELIKISALMEPRMREGLARSIARRFDEQQLGEINAFLTTPSGKAFAGQTIRMWMDPDVMRSMAQSAPHMIAAMPGAMMRLEAETAHLPKPKKAAEKKAKPTN